MKEKNFTTRKPLTQRANTTKRGDGEIKKKRGQYGAGESQPTLLEGGTRNRGKKGEP